MDQSSNQTKGIFYAVVAAVMWGILAIALKVSLKDLSSGSIVWVRFSIAFVILLVYMAIKEPSMLRIFIHPPIKLIIAALCLGFNYYGFMKGIEFTTPGNAQIFIQLGPVLFAMTGIYIFKEKINWKHITGFTIVLFGLGFFYWEQVAAMTNLKVYAAGILWLVGASVSWSVYALFQKDLTMQYSVNQLNIFIYGLCTLLFSPMPEYPTFFVLHTGSWLLVLFLGLNTLIAYGAIALAFRYLDSGKVSVITTMNPILTFLLMYIFAEMNVTWIAAEHFSAISITGAALALGGAVFVILFTRKD